MGGVGKLKQNRWGGAGGIFKLSEEREKLERNWGQREPRVFLPLYDSLLEFSRTMNPHRKLWSVMTLPSFISCKKHSPVKAILCSR